MAGRSPDGRPQQAALRWLAAPLGFATTAVVATWPMITKLGTHLPGFGANTDNLFHIVFSRWFAVALAQGQNPYQVWWTLFPAGSDSFLGKNGTCFNAALSAPLQPLFGVLRSTSPAWSCSPSTGGLRTAWCTTSASIAPPPSWPAWF